VQLPGVSPLSSHTGRLPLDVFGTGLQIAEEDHVVASCSSCFLVFACNCVAL
jgi:2,3-bisphosphoglycerate-independent phosphoglycerate mutase